MEVISTFLHINAWHHHKKYEVQFTRHDNVLLVNVRRRNKRGDIMFEKFLYFADCLENIQILRYLRAIFGGGKIHFKIVGGGRFRINEYELKIVYNGTYYNFILMDRDGKELYRESFHYSTGKEDLPINWNGFTLNDVKRVYNDLLNKYHHVTYAIS